MWYHTHIGGERCPIVDTWWQTETGGHMITPLPGVITTKPGSATFPLPGIGVEVVDDDGNPVEQGGGYLTLTQPWPSMLRGIWGDPERYRDTYWSSYEGRYFAGDGAKIDDDGYLWLLGRVDDVMNVSGHRISTTEVESALVDHPAVAEAAVVGATDDTTGQAIVGYVILRGGYDADARSWARRSASTSPRRSARSPGPRPWSSCPTCPRPAPARSCAGCCATWPKGRDLGDTTTLADAGWSRRSAAGPPRRRRRTDGLASKSRSLEERVQGPLGRSGDAALRGPRQPRARRRALIEGLVDQIVDQIVGAGDVERGYRGQPARHRREGSGPAGGPGRRGAAHRPGALRLLGHRPAVAQPVTVLRLVAGGGGGRLAVSLKTPVLMVVALAVMAVCILGLMWGVNTTYVVAELPGELVMMANRRGRLELRGPPGRSPSKRPRDRRWLKVEVAGRRLWVSGAPSAWSSRRWPLRPSRRHERGAPGPGPRSRQLAVATGRVEAGPAVGVRPGRRALRRGRSPALPRAAVPRLGGVLRGLRGRSAGGRGGAPARGHQSRAPGGAAHRTPDPGPAPDAGLARSLPVALGPADHARLRRLRTSREFKRRTVFELRHYGFDLRLAFEDDRRNYDMFHAEGVPCVYIHSGYYE